MWSFGYSVAIFGVVVAASLKERKYPVPGNLTFVLHKGPLVRHVKATCYEVLPREAGAFREARVGGDGTADGVARAGERRRVR